MPTPAQLRALAQSLAASRDALDRARQSALAAADGSETAFVHAQDAVLEALAPVPRGEWGALIGADTLDVVVGL